MQGVQYGPGPDDVCLASAALEPAPPPPSVGLLRFVRPAASSPTPPRLHPLQKLDLSHAWRVSEDSLLRLARARPRVEVALLEGVWRLSDVGLGALAAAWPGLHTLAVGGPGPTPLTLGGVAALLAAAPQLALLRLAHVPLGGWPAFVAAAAAAAGHRGALQLVEVAGVPDAAAAERLHAEFAAAKAAAAATAGGGLPGVGGRDAAGSFEWPSQETEGPRHDADVDMGTPDDAFVATAWLQAVDSRAEALSKLTLRVLH